MTDTALGHTLPMQQIWEGKWVKLGPGKKKAQPPEAFEPMNSWSQGAPSCGTNNFVGAAIFTQMDRNSGPNKYHLASPKLFISLKSNTQVNKQTDKQTSKQKELKERKIEPIRAKSRRMRFWTEILASNLFNLHFRSLLSKSAWTFFVKGKKER